MITKRFDFNFKPLRVSYGLTVETGVPQQQTYDATAGEYAPDFRLTPLTVQPFVNIVDPDGILADGSVNGQLAEMTWYEIIDGTRTQINDANTAYSITRTIGSEQFGRLQMRKNVNPLKPVTLEFNAKFLDGRTGQVFDIRSSILVRCINSTVKSKVEIDAAYHNLFNPLRDYPMWTLHAKLWHGGELVPDDKRYFRWRIYDQDTQTYIELTDPLAYSVTEGSNADHSTVTIDRSLMGYNCTVVCDGAVLSDENVAALTDPEGMVYAASAQATFIRRIPKLEYDIMAVPTLIPPTLAQIKPKAGIRDNKGMLADETGELRVDWYVATNTATGNDQKYTFVGTGAETTVSTKDYFSKAYGAMLAVDVTDRGPWLAACTATGDVLTDGEGNILLLR